MYPSQSLSEPEYRPSAFTGYLSCGRYFTRYQKMGFDFFSAHLCATTTHFFRKIILGDYRTQWGQGLVAWGGFSSGKSSLALGNEKSGKGFSPHTSTDENNFLRGVALSLQPLPSLQTDLFFSSYYPTICFAISTVSLASLA